MTSEPASLPRFAVTAAVALLLAVHAWLAVTATIELGVTGDETVHLMGGYSYWQFNDYRLHPENGNLPQRWAALPLLALQPRLEPADEPQLWSRSDVWQIAHGFLFASGNNTDFMLLCSRATMVLWSLGTALLVFCWSRRLWGDRGGVWSLFLYAVSPTILAHAALVTSDACATFCLLAATGAWCRLTRHCDGRSLALSLLVTALAVVAKFSGLLLLPIVLLISGWRVAQSAPIVVALWPRAAPRNITGWAGKSGLLLAVGTAHLAMTVAVIWACFGFRYSAFAPGLPEGSTFFLASDAVVPRAGAARWLFLQARDLHLLPQAFLHGLGYVLHAAQSRGSFLAGEYSSTGWWWFFPFAFFVKSTIAELVAAASLPLFFALTWSRERSAVVHKLKQLTPLLILAGVYGTASLTSHLNIGQRHILPLYPVLFIAAGSLVAFAPRRAGWFVMAALGTVAAYESATIRPHYLAFFNRLAGGPDAGWRLLGDSSLDWGQNLPRLARWLAEHEAPGRSVYLSYFGADDPFYQGLRVTELSPYYTFGRPLRWAALRGGTYCIGASMLQDASSPYRGPWSAGKEARYQHLRTTAGAEAARGVRSAVFGFGVSDDMDLWGLDRARFARLCVYLRARAPDAIVGHMIFIYQLSDDEVRRAVDGTLAELVEAVATAAQPPGLRQFAQPDH